MPRGSRSGNVDRASDPGLEKTMTSKEPLGPSPMEDPSIFDERTRSAVGICVALCAIFALASVEVILTARRRRASVAATPDPADR